MSGKFMFLNKKPLSQREQSAIGRLSSFTGPFGPRVSGYEGNPRPGYGNARVSGYGGNGTYGPLSSNSTEKEIWAFQGLLNFQLTIVNAALATRTFRLTPGLLGEGAPGLIQLGAFSDIDGNPGLTGSTTMAQTIAQLVNFYSLNPTKLLAMKFTSTVDSQGELNINAFVRSPFRQLESKNIPLAQYSDGMTQNPKQTFANMIPYDLQLDSQADIQIPVAASSSLNLLIFAGPILNSAQILDAKTSGM